MSYPTPSRDLWAIFLPVRTIIHSSLILASLGAAATVAALTLAACLIGGMADGREEICGRLSLWQTLAAVAACTFMALLLRGAATCLSHIGAFRLEEMLRQNLAEHLGRLPMGFAIAQGTGALKKILMDDVKNLHAFVADSIPFIGRCATVPLASSGLLLYFDWRLAIITFVILLCGVGLFFFVMRDSEVMRSEYDISQEKINNAVIEFAQGMPVIRTFDDGSDSFQRFVSALEHYRKATTQWIAMTGVPARLGMFVLSPLPVLVCVSVAGMLLRYSDSLTFTALLGCLLLCTGIADCVGPLMWLEGFIKKSQAAAFRIHDVLAIPALPVPCEPRIPQRADLAFHNVTFRYEGKEQPALADVSFAVPQGSVTALVGLSGSGKSTVIRLVPRFWDVSEGAVMVGGVDAREIAPETLMGMVSFVFQDNFLFRDTIEHNLRLAKPDATNEELYAAAEAANLHAFILSLPQGYQTLVDERGASLSGGQRQRLAIARAMLRNAPILLLDEPTAFADPESEKAVVSALSKLIVGKTVLIIAHRLALIRHADQILVLDRGQIVERGNHEILCCAGGVYQRLWELHEQSGDWNLRA